MLSRVASLLAVLLAFPLGLPAATPASGPGAAGLDAICGQVAGVPPTTLPLKLARGARVAFIGNGLFERMQEHAWFEAMLLRRFPREEPVLRTLAWPGDEVAVMPRPADYGDLHRHLAAHQADVILAAYGLNESFRGVEALPQFERDLATLLVSLRLHHYNGRSAPQVILVSPVAHENLRNPDLPDGLTNNLRLRLYTDAMARVARRCGVAFVDVFGETRAAMQLRAPDAALTVNGIHLTDTGYRLFGELLFRGLFGETPPEVPAGLKAAVEARNREFLVGYRPLNGFYITGGRKSPYGVVNFPGEIERSQRLTAGRDRRAWDIAQDKPVAVEPGDRPAPDLPVIPGPRPVNEWLKPADELSAFRVDPRFAVNLFAAEEQFPELAKPIQMRFDTRGRLWVSCSTTYPQVLPGEAPADKLIVLEDTDGDGRADRSQVFATGLNIPLSFEFGDGGVYVSEQPHLTFLKDTDGDGRADLRRIVLTGFGTEDSHHALHDFTWTPEGDLVFRESIFLHSSVETPYGPVRARDSSFFRFRPATQRLTAFGSYYSTNPWGLTFDDWGWHLGSHPVFASAVHALNPPYPEQQPSVRFPAYSGTCGQEFIRTRHFPDDLQGCFIRVRYKPVNTVEIHRWVEHDTHFEEQKIGHVWQSSNLSFIPVDVRFGPRGDLYVCDWYNPVKGHMQYSLRDTRRDKTSGRIWRITAKGRPLDPAPAIAGEPIPRLLDLLKAYEYRTRYTAKLELRERDPAAVRTALDRWTGQLDPRDPQWEHHRVEALWMHANLRTPNPPLLRSLLRSTNLHARAAATRQLRWWHEAMPDALDLLRERANDPSGLVRLEAAIAASYFQSVAAAGVALDVRRHPMDAYLDHALQSALLSLKPLWAGDAAFAGRHPDVPAYLASSTPGARKAAAKKAARADPFDRLNPLLVEISTVHERMQFTVTEFKVKAGAPVKLVLENPDATPHNLLICQPGAADEVGELANAMARLPDAFEKGDFVPKSPRVLHATRMLGPNQTDTLRFRAPTQPGRYPYICSFPGHYLVMRGVMVVE